MYNDIDKSMTDINKKEENKIRVIDDLYPDKRLSRKEELELIRKWNKASAKSITDISNKYIKKGIVSDSNSNKPNNCTYYKIP